MEELTFLLLNLHFFKNELLFIDRFTTGNNKSMALITYNIPLQGDEQFTNFWFRLLAETNNAYNYLSNAITADKTPCGIVAVHNKYYSTLRSKFPTLPSQTIIRVQRSVIAALKSAKSNKHHGNNPHKVKLSMILDKRMYSNFTAEGISLISDTPNKRKRFTFHLYDKVKELFATSAAKDPTIFVRDGQLYLSVPFEVQGKTPTDDTCVGVDLGMRQFFVTSEGKSFVDKQYLAERRRVRYLKRCLQSKGTSSAKRHLRKLRKRERNISKAMCHKAVNALLESTSTSVIVLEDLSKIKQRTSKTKEGFKRTKHNNAIGQVPFYQFKQILTYKATLVGKQVVSVSPTYTSQTDCRTNKRDGVRKGRIYICSDGLVLDADWNAAVNIAQRSEHPLSSSTLPLSGRLQSINRTMASHQTHKS